MIFTELVLENFGAYANRNAIDLRPEVEGVIRPILLLGGMNGGGKTTLVDAIRLALYGQRARCSTRGNLGYGSFLTQSINSRIDKDTSPEPASGARAVRADITKIELTFEHIVNDQWKEFKIVRAWNRSDNLSKDSLSIKVNNDYDDNLAQNWDEYVENILPLGISNLFLFDGEQVKELAELDTPPQSVVEAISNLLGLELAEKLTVDLEVLLSRKRKAVASKSQLQTIEEIEARLAQLERRKQESLNAIDELQQQLIKAQKKQKTAYNKFRNDGGKIAADRSNIEAKIEATKQNIDRVRNDIINLSATSLPLQLISPLLQQAESQGDREIKRQKIQQSQEIIKERDAKLFKFLEKLPLSEEYLDKIDFFLEQEDRKLDKAFGVKGEAYLDIDEETQKHFVNILNTQLPLTIEQTKAKILDLKQLVIGLDDLEKQLAIAAPPEAYKKLDDALTAAQKKLEKCQLEYDRAQYQDRQLDREIDNTKKELKNYSESHISVVNDEHIINSVVKVQETLDRFREKLTLKKLNKLEVEVTECFRYLLHKSNLVHKVVIERHSFRISLYDPQGKLLPKQRLSAGEKQLLAISFLWGLARVSGRDLPIAIDTPLGRLDSDHRQNLVERYFPAASHQVILLSTDTEIGEKEVAMLREQDAIAREYLLKYDPEQRQTTVESGYFW